MRAARSLSDSGLSGSTGAARPSMSWAPHPITLSQALPRCRPWSGSRGHNPRSMPFPPLNFCSKCGAKLVLRVPPGDSLPRHVCDDCGTIHYRNPLSVVGVTSARKDQVLLCKRAIEPRHGLWTLPAGFMENGETILAGAERETAEEARARVEVDAL